jgi:3-methyladenine DNA glycosylase AlkD
MSRRLSHFAAWATPPEDGTFDLMGDTESAASLPRVCHPRRGWRESPHAPSRSGGQEDDREVDLSMSSSQTDAQSIAARIEAEIAALPEPNTPRVRTIRREYSRRLQDASSKLVLDVARGLIQGYGHRWVAYELVRNHEGAFATMDGPTLEALGEGIDSWWTVDSFARTLSGPAWLRGQAPDDLIVRWARSDDLWWRRAALVSTVALNIRSHGGYGDTERTLRICRLLAGDHEDMVVKAVSWALRALSIHDPDAVRAFLDEFDDVLAARVKREVKNKLLTGLKNP